ncbi:MAG: DNA repair protein RecO [Phycisphaerae bacterium]|nr:DNA repair protein RecO [Phycisphaerae bacterium]
MLIKDQAICIRATDFSETSQVVTFFARDHGKVAVLAKGAKRPRSPFGGPIERFSHGGLVFADSPHARLATLTEFLPRCDLVRGLSGKISAYHAALLATELLDGLTHDRDPHPVLHDRFLHFLQEVLAGPAVLGLLIRFQWVLLKEIGLQPVVDACVNCRTPYATTWPACSFSSSANGLVCRDCEGAFADRLCLTPRTAQTLAQIDCLTSASPSVLQDMERLLLGHFTQILHRRPKSAEIALGTLFAAPRTGR